MLQSLFNRLLSRTPSAPAPAPALAKVARPAQPAVTRSAAVAAAPAVTMGARRPLVGADGALAGFEFTVSPQLVARLLSQSTATAALALTANVLAAMRMALGPGRQAYSELPAAWLEQTTDDQAFAPGMVLLTTADASQALVKRLRGLGVRLGWRPEQVPADVRPDFVLVPADQAGDASHLPGVPRVVLDAADVDDMERLLKPPVFMAACAPVFTTEPASAQALSPQARHLMSLMARLVRDDDQAALVADIKADASLALRLLQYMNSAGASPGRSLESIEDAVMVLGRNALYRWCAHLLVRMGPSRPSASALQSLALARARLFESLALGRGEPASGSLYLMGLASLLPLLLRSSVGDALSALHLPAAAQQALRDGQGPWADYLSLVQALERADMQAAKALAEPFGGLERVLAESANSWR